MVSRGREFWVATVAEFERSNVTQQVFALRRRVSPSTLQYWICKLRRERQASVSLIPVRVVASTAPSARQAEAAAAGEIELELKSGLRIRFAAGVDVEYVSALVQRLG